MGNMAPTRARANVFEVRYSDDYWDVLADEYDNLADAISCLNRLFGNGYRDVRIIQR